MKIINGKKFLEDSDKVRVGKTIVNHHWGLNAVLDGYHDDEGVMTWGEFRNRRQDGTYPDDDGICEYRWIAVPCKE